MDTQIKNFSRIIVVCLLTAVVGTTSVLASFDYEAEPDFVENTIPLNEEPAENSSNENLNSENEDKFFEDHLVRGNRSELLSWIIADSDQRGQKVYRKVPSPPPDLSS